MKVGERSGLCDGDGQPPTYLMIATIYLLLGKLRWSYQWTSEVSAMNEKKINFQVEAEELKQTVKTGIKAGGDPITLAMAAVKATSCWGARVNC